MHKWQTTCGRKELGMLRLVLASFVYVVMSEISSLLVVSVE